MPAVWAPALRHAHCQPIRTELLAIQEGTKRPYNVNFFAHTPPEIDAARNLKWKNALAPYYSEMGLNIEEFPSGQGRTPFNAESAELLEEFKPPYVSFHFGLPKPELLKRVKAMGAQIISSATTVDEALWLQAQGCDFIIAQGLEAGGHRGHFLNHDLNLQMGTFALLPQIVKAVNVPVIAAGGIASSKGVTAAMALGAGAGAKWVPPTCWHRNAAPAPFTEKHCKVRLHATRH